MSGATEMLELTIESCEALRREIKVVTEKLGYMSADSISAAPSEANVNRMLAFRHLEDAAMRLGKCIQALDGGVSVYDKRQVSEVLP